jgi:hypothetical protein
MKSILVLGVTIEMFMYSRKVDFTRCSDNTDIEVGTPAYVLQSMDDHIATLHILARSIDAVEARAAAAAAQHATQQQQGAAATNNTDDDSGRRCIIQ